MMPGRSCSRRRRRSAVCSPTCRARLAGRRRPAGLFRCGPRARCRCTRPRMGRSCTRTWDGSTSKTYISTLADNGFIQSMSRTGNCIDNGATEQVFGHLEDEILPWPRLADIRELQSRPRRLHHTLEHNKTPSKAQGPDPGRIPGPGPTGSRITATHLKRPSFGAQFI